MCGNPSVSFYIYDHKHHPPTSSLLQRMHPARGERAVFMNLYNFSHNSTERVEFAPQNFHRFCTPTSSRPVFVHPPGIFRSHSRQVSHKPYGIVYTCLVAFRHKLQPDSRVSTKARENSCQRWINERAYVRVCVVPNSGKA